MKQDHSLLFQTWRWKLGILIVSLFLFFLNVTYGQSVQQTEKPMLSGTIEIQSNEGKVQAYQKIQPGTPIKFELNIENKGEGITPEGEVYIRYAFIKQLEHEPNNIVFQTEKVPVPSLKQGQNISIKFETSQQLPSLVDFIRYDYPMREYQAYFIKNDKEYLIGKLILTFSAYYYPSLRHEIPVVVD